MKGNALKLPQSQEFGQCQYGHVANDAWRGICLWDTATHQDTLKTSYPAFMVLREGTELVQIINNRKPVFTSAKLQGGQFCN